MRGLLEFIRRRRPNATPFWGKYRGTVVDNVDPADVARVRVKVPEVLGDGVNVWALPSLSDARRGNHVPPPVGANVWVEFEGGDPDRPIWTGVFWIGA